MTSKECTKCGETKNLSNFYKHPISGDGYFGACKDCAKSKQNRRNKTNKARLVEYKGGACERCGGVFHPAVFDFHHRNPDEKSFGIGVKASGNFDRLKAEVDKCLLLCANCHRMEHYSDE